MTAVAIPILETERLILREYRASDFEDYAGFYADPVAPRHVGGSRPRSGAWVSLCAMAGHWQLRGYGMWALERKDSGDFVGRVGPYFPEGWPEPEIGWTLMLGQTGQGFATEAALRARQYAYEDLGWRTAISFIEPENTASIRLAERMGAVYETTMDSFAGPHAVYRHPSPDSLARGSA